MQLTGRTRVHEQRAKVPRKEEGEEEEAMPFMAMGCIVYVKLP